jgi:predicted acyltransferase
MKTQNLFSTTTLVLKITGGILILLYLLDFFILLSAAKFQDNQWLLTFTTQLVDRGFVPLMGMAFLFAGLWTEHSLNQSETPGEPAKGLRLATLLLSCILGLLFLLIVPVNVRATQVAVDEQLKQVAQEATRAEGQLDSQVQQLKGQLDAQLAALDQAIKGGQLQGDQLAQAQKQQEQLRKLKDDPKALDAQIDPSRKQELEKIKSRKQELETQLRDNAVRSALRTGLGSLLMAIGYVIVGWTGLRRML